MTSPSYETKPKSCSVHLRRGLSASQYSSSLRATVDHFDSIKMSQTVGPVCIPLRLPIITLKPRADLFSFLLPQTRLAYARTWHLIDVGSDSRSLGRLASRIAIALMGKHKPIWDPYSAFSPSSHLCSFPLSDIPTLTHASRLRRLRSSHWMSRPPHHWAEALSEEILPP